MKRDGVSAQTLGRLSDLEAEYDLTIRCLSVLVERVQQLTGTTEVTIERAAVDDQPDLTAWRNSADSISLKTVR